MARKKRQILVRKPRTRTPAPSGRGLGFWTLAGLAVLLLYVWGRVQIDFVIQGNDRLREERNRLHAEVDDLVVQVSAMKSYQRIVDLAQKRGLVSLSPSQIAEVTVDLEGLDPLPVTDTDGLRYAGVSSLLDMARQKKER